MPILRLQAILEHVNGLARDAVVNTFHVTVADVDVASDLLDNVVNFYALDISGTRSVGDWMAQTHPTVYVKAYEVNDVLVGDKVVSNSGAPLVVSLTNDISSDVVEQTNMPSEVACCLSMRSNVAPSIPRARRTGRVYVGPLNRGCQDTAVANSIPRPHASFLNDLRSAAARMQDGLLADGGALVVYSRPFPGRDAIERPGRTTLPALPARPNMTTHLVDQVWTDDAFDTQRRRGERATGKTVQAV